MFISTYSQTFHSKTFIVSSVFKLADDTNILGTTSSSDMIRTFCNKISSMWWTGPNGGTGRCSSTSPTILAVTTTDASTFLDAHQLLDCVDED